MAKILIARGQATIYVQKDGDTITQSLGEYVFPADDTGKILSSVTLTSTVRVMCGDEELTAFTIGAVGKPAGFSSVTVNNGTKTLTYVITAGTTTLADHGTIDIPVTISGIVYHLSFVWSKAKAGIPGKDGVDADMLDWVKEWNTGKTLINGNTVITPKLFAGTKNSDGTVSDNDSVIFFNFRPDRAREITRAIVDPDFTGFQREFFPTTYVCNTEYDASMPNVLVAWPRVAVKNGLGEYLSSLSLTQLRIAETEKYAHVTFFFNGGVEKQYPGEDRVLVPSPKVATYDLQPEMSAYEVCDKCVERINSGAYDVVILNFANCDMVGHTGVLEAAVKAVETVDTCVGRVVEATLKMGGIAMITADHGNAEVMRQPDGSPMTAHTTNPVPFILCGAGTELRTGRLADIAPTILDVMGLACPPEMDGKSLIVR